MDLRLDEYASQDQIAQDCDSVRYRDKTAHVSCNNFLVPRKRLEIKILSAIYGQSNSPYCQGMLEDRCYDLNPNITDFVSAL